MTKNIFKRVVFTLLIILFSTTWYHNVSKKITSEDKIQIESLLNFQNEDVSKINDNFENQITFIKKIQSIVIDSISPSQTGIPLGRNREPINVIQYGQGQCFDRSRLIEKILIHYGFKIRHLSIYKMEESTKLLKTLLSTGTPSHATVEVKTLKGWMIVDSNTKWLSLDKNSLPMNFKNLNPDKFHQQPDVILLPFYSNNSLGIYGLYSRHGHFYPPYNRIPDFNFRELFYNLNI